MKIQHTLTNKQRRSLRTHKNVVATADRPKLLITRTNKYIYLQVLDEQGKILMSESDERLLHNKTMKTGLTKTARSVETGKALAAALKAKKIKALAVDRGSCKFHGRIKAAVETIKDNGVEV